MADGVRVGIGYDIHRLAVGRRLVLGGVEIEHDKGLVVLSPHKRQLAESIAALTGLSADLVGVKAKTNEGVGPLGYTDVIACTAVALVRGKS